MSLDTTKIIHACEKMWTYSKRVQFAHLRDDHRMKLLNTFEVLATDLGKIVTRFGKPDWLRVQIAVTDLHSAAISDEEARAGTFHLIGSEMALVTSLHGLAANLGCTLEDAATAHVEALNPEDEQARLYAEGHGKVEVLDAAE